jgi:hypothetical protein
MSFCLVTVMQVVAARSFDAQDREMPPIEDHGVHRRRCHPRPVVASDLDPIVYIRKVENRRLRVISVTQQNRSEIVLTACDTYGYIDSVTLPYWVTESVPLTGRDKIVPVPID